MKKRALAFMLVFVMCFCGFLTIQISNVEEDEHDHAHIHVYAADLGEEDDPTSPEDPSSGGGSSVSAFTPFATISAGAGTVDHEKKTVTFNIKIKGITDDSAMNERHAYSGFLEITYDSEVFDFYGASGTFMDCDIGGYPIKISDDGSKFRIELENDAGDFDQYSILSDLEIVFSYGKADFANLSSYEKKFTMTFESHSGSYPSYPAPTEEDPDRTISNTYTRSKTLSAMICSHPSTHTVTVEKNCMYPEHIDTVCDICGTVIASRSTGAALGGHVYDYEDMLKLAYYTSCKTSGAETQVYCRVCGKLLPVKDLEYHTGLDTSRKLYDAETGKYYYQCNDCGAHVTARIQSATKCAEHTFGEWTTTKEATCTSEGLKTRVCIVCGEKETSPIEKKAHSFVTWETVEAATCTKEGLETSTCENCGATTTRPTEKIPHTYSEWKTIKEATCTEDGEDEAVCDVCGEKTTKPIEKLGHSFGEWTTVKAATCVSPGYRVRYCSNCGEAELEEIPASEEYHNYIRTVTREASCYESGIVEYICQYCGDTDTSRTEITASHGHSFTTSRSGNATVKTCSVCGMSVVETAGETRVSSGAFTLVIDTSKSAVGEVWLKAEEIAPSSDEYAVLSARMKSGYSIQNAYNVSVYINGEKSNFTENMTLTLSIDKALSKKETDVFRLIGASRLESVSGASRKNLEISMPGSSLLYTSGDSVVLGVQGDKVVPGGSGETPGTTSDDKNNIIIPIIIISIAVVATGAILFAVLNGGKSKSKFDF